MKKDSTKANAFVICLVIASFFLITLFTYFKTDGRKGGTLSKSISRSVDGLQKENTKTKLRNKIW